MLLCDEIKRRRLALGLSVRAAAVAAWGDEGWHSRWSRLERGAVSSPELRTIDAVARVLKCRTWDLIDP